MGSVGKKEKKKKKLKKDPWRRESGTFGGLLGLSFGSRGHVPGRNAAQRRPPR